MKLKIEKMTEQDAFQIFIWKYTAPYDWYNLEGDDTCLNEFLEDSYYVAKDEGNRLVGFFCYGTSAQVSSGQRLGFYEDETYLDIGLGMNPLLCGKGYGASFLELGMQYATKTLGAHKFRLTVADFNERAIKMYQKVGFHEIGVFEARNQVEHIRFRVMCKPTEDVLINFSKNNN